MVTTTDLALAPQIPDSSRGIEQRGIDHIPDDERRGRDLEADDDTIITPLDGSTGYPSVTAGEYLTERRQAATVA